MFINLKIQEILGLASGLEPRKFMCTAKDSNIILDTEIFSCNLHRVTANDAISHFSSR